MDFYFAKAGKGNEDFETYLGEGTDKKYLPIYFNGDFEEKIALKKWAIENKKGDVNSFFTVEDLPNTSRIILMNNKIKKFYILKPNGDVEFRKICRDGSDEYKVKLMPINVLKTLDYKELPLIILGMGANQYLIRGTFRKIDHDRYPGLHWALNKLIDGRQTRNKPSPLRLIGSVELETLIAKIFEARGFFVPARAGGNLPEIDLLPKNLTARNIKIFGINVKPGEVVPIQVKLTPSERGSAWLNICIDSNNKSDWIDERGIQYELAKFESRKTNNPNIWLDQLLSWSN